MNELILPKTDCRIPRKEIRLEEMTTSMMQEHLQKQNETCDMNQSPQSYLSQQYSFANQELHRIFARLQNESTAIADASTTFSAPVATLLSQYIAECLADVEPQKTDTAYIQALLEDYRVIVSLHGQKPSVSLHRLHLILQDNYKDSSLCKLLDVLLAGHLQTETKVINFKKNIP